MEEGVIFRMTATTAEEEAVVRTTATTVHDLEAINVIITILGHRRTLVSHTMLPTNIAGYMEATIIHPVDAQGKLRTTRTQQPSQIAWEGQVISAPLYHDSRRRN